MTTTVTRNPSGLERVPEWVGAQAAATPQALAVMAGHRRLTYGQLEAPAERLANRLSSLGVGPDVIVGLLLQNSPALGVGALRIPQGRRGHPPPGAPHP